MKERLDCALIRIPGCEPLVEALLKHDRTSGSRLHFSVVNPSPGAGQAPYPSISLMQDLTYSLRHVDAVCLPVSTASLVWTRLLLQQTAIEQHRPIFVLGMALRPIGLHDLLELGVVDFALWPCEPDEIRVRLLRALRQLRQHQARLPSLLGDSISAKPYTMHDAATASLARLTPASALPFASEQSGHVFVPSVPSLRQPVQSISTGSVVGVRSGSASSHAPVSLLRGGVNTLVQSGRSTLHHHAQLSVPRVCCQEIAQYHEGFQQLKSVVVAQFERTYLTHALARSKGNIALAARNSNKHRRAFWALMRKHQISAEPFRDHGF